MEVAAQNALPRQLNLSGPLMRFDTGPRIPSGALAPNL